MLNFIKRNPIFIISEAGKLLRAIINLISTMHSHFHEQGWRDILETLLS